MAASASTGSAVRWRLMPFIGVHSMQCAGTPADVSGVVVSLVSDHFRFVTGTVVDVNNGQYFG